MKSKKDEFNKEMNSGWVLTNKQIDFISRYPLFYNAWAVSYLETLCLQKFWIYLSKFIPKSIAPSTLTFVGLSVNLFGCITVLYYSPDFKNSEIPRFVPLLLALTTFLYQTLDALDGKQAYKVQNSAIEELSDHGADALSSVFVTLSTAALLQLGNHPLLLVTFLIISLLAFFFTHFVSHITHCMIFGKIDVTEAQIGCIFGYILTAIYGQKIWLYPLIEFSGLRLTTGNLLVLSGVAFLLCSICDNIKFSLMGKQTPIEQLGINIPRKKIKSKTYNSLIAVGFLIVCCYINYFYGLMKLNPLVFLFIYGFSFAKLIITLVMVNVSRGDFDKINSSLIAPCLLTLNCLISNLYGDFLMNCYTALLCSFIWTTTDCLRYFTYAMWDVASALDVYVFSVKYPVGHPLNKAPNKDGCYGFYFNGTNEKEVLQDWNKFKNDENSLMKEIFLNHLD